MNSRDEDDLAPAEAMASDRGQSTDRQMVNERASVRSTQSCRASYMKTSVLSTNSGRALTGAVEKEQRQPVSRFYQFLQYIDIYPIEIQLHINNQFKQPTFCGGVLTILTYLVLTLLIAIKGYSVLAENRHHFDQPRRLDEAQKLNRLGGYSRFLQSSDPSDNSDPNANPTHGAADAEQESSSNFDFWTYQDEDFNQTSYASHGSPLAVSSFGISKVQVVMNLRGFQDQYDADMVSVLDALSKISREDYDKGDFSKYYVGDP